MLTKHQSYNVTTTNAHTYFIGARSFTFHVILHFIFTRAWLLFIKTLSGIISHLICVAHVHLVTYDKLAISFERSAIHGQGSISDDALVLVL